MITCRNGSDSAGGADALACFVWPFFPEDGGVGLTKVVDMIVVLRLRRRGSPGEDNETHSDGNGCEARKATDVGR